MLTYDKPNDWVEDTFVMNQNSGGPESTSMSGMSYNGGDYGSGIAQYPQEVVISCPLKQGRVRGSLSGNINLNINAEWQELFGGGIASMTNSILGTANSLVQYAIGATIQQPWMNRKVYKNTKPFSFDLPINFVAIDDAKEDVVKPVLALVSFCYPRKYTEAVPQLDENGNVMKDENGNDKTVNVQVSALSGAKKAGKNVNFIQRLSPDDMVGSFLDMFKIWEIPGPSIISGQADKENGGHKGDAVDIIVGKLFNLGNCYLENVSIKFASSYDRQGYPLYANVTVKCTCADSVVCDEKGNFLVNKIEDQSEALANFLNQTGETVMNVVENVSQIAKFVTGYHKGTLNVQEVK